MKRIPQQKLFERIGTLSAGEVGLYIEDLDSGERFEVNPSLVFPSASVIKIPILALLLKDARDKGMDLYAPHTMNPENRVGGTGILCELEPAYCPPVYYLAKLMIILSDNSATNEIIDLVGGFERVTAFCRETGYHNTSLNRKMMDFDAIAQGRNNYISAGDAGRMLCAVAKGEFVDAQISRTIVDMMNGQQYRNKLPARLPAVPTYAKPEDKKKLKPGSVLVANKTGDLFGIQHDVGIFTLPDNRRYVIAVLTGGLADDADGINLVADISKMVYEALK